MHCYRRRCGFTLVELLVVVLIIAILATLILPARQRFGHRRMTPCQSNLKRMYLGLYTYIQDYGDVFPEATCDSGASGGNWYQVLVTQGYIKDKKVFVCPSDPSPDTFNTGLAWDSSGRPSLGIDPLCYYYDPVRKRYRPGDLRSHVDELFPDGGSYGMNREVGGRDLREITHKSRTPLIMGSIHPSFEDGTRAIPDSSGFTIMPNDAPFAGPHNARFHGGKNTRYVKEDVDPDARSSERLLGGNNVIYLDGHTEFLSGAQLGNRSPKCDTDPTKHPSGRPFETDPTEPGCGEEVD